MLTKLDVLICLAKKHKTKSILAKTECLFSKPSFCLMPYRAPITPWDKNKTFSITCQAYLTRCLHFSTALWSLCYKALAPQASFLVLKQDKFILYRPPLHLLFLLLGTPASLMLKICSWGRLLLIRSINCIPLLTPGLSLSTVLSLFFSQYLTESTHKLPSFFKKKLICVYVCFGVYGCVSVCVRVQDRD